MMLKNFSRLILLIALTGFSLTSFSSPLTIDGTPTANEKPTAQQLMVRLHEIKELAKTDLSPSEKNDLRKEVKDIRKQLKQTSKGIYLSVGAIIIILLILILLLR